MTSNDINSRPLVGNSADLSAVEDASADLCTAAVLVDCAENSLNGIRGWLDALHCDTSMVREVLQIDTLLFEIRHKIESAKKEIDGFTSAQMKTRASSEA